MFIKTVLDSDVRLLITAPRRFGKSVNISMLKHFFERSPDEEVMEKNRKLFEETQIWKCSEIMREHQGKYPVIFLDFKSSSTISSLQTARDVLASVGQKAFLTHEYLATSDDLKDHEKEKVKE